MILGSLIVIVSILALAGMSFPVVRAVSNGSILAGNTRSSVEDPGGVEARKAENQAAADAAAEVKRKGLKEVKDKGLRERRLRLKKQCSLMANIDTINKHAKKPPKNSDQLYDT